MCCSSPVPGHGAPGVVANTWLEGTYSELYPDVSQDEAGMCRLFRQFSFPGGDSQPCGPADAGLDPRGRRARLFAVARLWRGVRQSRSDRRLRHRRRRSRNRAAGDLLAWQQIPRSRRRTARCCRSCISTATRSPIHGVGADRLERTRSLLRGYGYAPIFVEGDDPDIMHQKMAAALNAAFARSGRSSRRARGRRIDGAAASGR